MNASDPAQVKAAQRRDAEARKERQRCVKAVLLTEDGRDFVWGLLVKAGMYESVFRPAPPNVDAPTFHGAKQDFGRMILAEVLEADEEAYFKMIKKNRNASAKPAAQSTAAPTGDAPAAEPNKGEGNDAEQ